MQKPLTIAKLLGMVIIIVEDTGIMCWVYILNLSFVVTYTSFEVTADTWRRGRVEGVLTKFITKSTYWLSPLLI